jgi:hypothetical protein
VREERHAPAVGTRRQQAEVALDELAEEPDPEKDPGRNADEEDEHERQHARARIQDEVGAEDGGDRAAGPERRNAPVRRRARQQRHERLDHRGDEAAGDVEAQVAHVAESVLDVLAEDRQEQHVAQDVIPAAVQEHGGEPAHTARLRAMAGIRHRAG